MTVLDMTGWRDKDSAKPEYRKLYEELPFIEAYAKHTDMRIAKDGPELAIGAKRDGRQDWDKHGKAQLQFLIDRGLKPESQLLDFGCGTGRLAQQAIPYLEHNGYLGIDISDDAIEHCYRKFMPGVAGHTPMFLNGDGTLKAVFDKGFTALDFIWAHSVLTHIPPDCVHRLLKDISEIQFTAFFFTYKEAKQAQRSGLKQFQYPKAWLINTAKLYGLKAEADPMEWPAGQKTMVVRRV